MTIESPKVAELKGELKRKGIDSVESLDAYLREVKMEIPLPGCRPFNSPRAIRIQFCGVYEIIEKLVCYDDPLGRSLFFWWAEACKGQDMFNFHVPGWPTKEQVLYERLLEFVKQHPVEGAENPDTIVMDLQNPQRGPRRLLKGTEIWLIANVQHLLHPAIRLATTSVSLRDASRWLQESWGIYISHASKALKVGMFP